MSSREGEFAQCLALAYLPMQKLEKITPSKSSALNSPVISFKAF
jgi:hypothetical protein